MDDAKTLPAGPAADRASEAVATWEAGSTEADRTLADVPRVAHVAVSVATVWTGPDSPRPVDAAALTNPVDPGGWLAAMTLADKYELSERNLSQTQVLYGEPV